jgi:hypothetical protein
MGWKRQERRKQRELRNAKTVERTPSILGLLENPNLDVIRKELVACGGDWFNFRGDNDLSINDRKMLCTPTAILIAAIDLYTQRHTVDVGLVHSFNNFTCPSFNGCQRDVIDDAVAVLKSGVAADAVQLWTFRSRMQASYDLVGRVRWL